MTDDNPTDKRRWPNIIQVGRQIRFRELRHRIDVLKKRHAHTLYMDRAGDRFVTQAAGSSSREGNGGILRAGGGSVNDAAPLRSLP